MKKGISSPVLLYTNFKDHADDDMVYSTSIEKFKKDMLQLIECGYKAISLKELNQYRKIGRYPEKTFCIAMIGGYEDNYRLAFPILKELNIPASIFVITDHVGLTSHPDFSFFTPHFTWEQGVEMHDSGLVDIYAMWHQLDEEKTASFSEIIKEKVNQVKKHIPAGDAQFAVYHNYCNDTDIQALNDIGIELKITFCINLTVERIENGCLGGIIVEYESDVIDIIGTYYHVCTEQLSKEQSVLEENVDEENTFGDFSSVELPIDSDPLIRNYLRHAFPLSVLGAERREIAERFVMNEYIDVIFKPQYDSFDYHNYYYNCWSCILCTKLTADIIKLNKINIVEYIINGLKLGYYCDIWLDTYYIPGKPGAGEIHMTHGLLIYGYDCEKNCFLALSYTERRMYEQLEVDAENIAAACSNRYFNYVNLFKRDAYETVKYDIIALCRKLYNYINSIVYDDSDTKYNKKTTFQYYNYEACLNFANYVEECAEKTEDIHTVAMYGFCEHKRCMAWRLKEIAKREKLEIEEIETYFDFANEKSLLLVNEALKYNMTQSKSIVKKIAANINELVFREKEAINILLYALNDRTHLQLP